MATSLSPRALYRAYLHHLRYIPDPHVWACSAPRMKTMLREGGHPTSTDTSCQQIAGAGSPAPLGTSKGRTVLQKAHQELRHLQAAVACHPHALVRLLEQCYGQRGRNKWQLVKRITLSSPLPADVWPTIVTDKEPLPRTRFPPSILQPLPAPLRPLRNPVGNIKPPQPRARTPTPKTALRREAKAEWEREWESFAVPLILPLNEAGSCTGWEDTTVVPGLMHLAGISQGTDSSAELPSLDRLPPSLRAVFPSRSPKGSPKEPYPRPPRQHTRETPNTWGYPRALSPRLLRRLYRRFWDDLQWVRPRVAKPDETHPTNGQTELVWVKCPYEEIFGAQPLSREGARWSLVREEDMQWV